MTLSVDKLNLRSPYLLMQLNDLTFSFVTDKQIHYNAGFYKDTYFMDEGAYSTSATPPTSGRLLATVSTTSGSTTTPATMR